MHAPAADSPSVSSTRIGVVITTFGAPAYVELQLALLSRYAPMRVLIADDASDQGAALESLARRWGADLFVNDHRLGHHRGDLAGFAAGLRWASARQLTHLVKFSRRFVALQDWPGGLQQLLDSRPTTVGAWCAAHHFFRTEAFAVDVQAWRPALKHLADSRWMVGECGDVVERYVYVLARAIAAEHHKTRPFEPWPLLGSSRTRRCAGVLWHDVNGTADYTAAARAIGLPLGCNDFEAYTGGFRNAAPIGSTDANHNLAHV